MAEKAPTVPPDADAIAEELGDAAVEVENPTVPLPVTVWLRAGTGVAHEVNVGSEAYRQLVANGAVVIDGPEPDECKVTDFAMVEKAKADDKPRR